MAIFAAPITTPGIPTTPATVSNLFSLIGEASQFAATGVSEGDIAAGDAAEAGAYTDAGNIARANARLALVGGDIEQAQEQIKLGTTLGSQRAAVAGGGFAESGTALNLLRSSTQQGHLEQQITGVNATLQSGGFEEQGAASDAEAAAATAAGASATALGTSAAALGASATTYATTTATSMGMTIPGIGLPNSVPSVPTTGAGGSNPAYEGGAVHQN
jgi:hypothetical protein